MKMVFKKACAAISYSILKTTNTMLQVVNLVKSSDYLMLRTLRKVTTNLNR
jgi:hypothetical protein